MSNAACNSVDFWKPLRRREYHNKNGDKRLRAVPGACPRRSPSQEKEKPQGGHKTGTRGLAGLVGRELRSLTALLVERNGAQKTPCQASWGKATASALCKLRPACGPGCKRYYTPDHFLATTNHSRFPMPHSRFLGSGPQRGFTGDKPPLAYKLAVTSP